MATLASRPSQRRSPIAAYLALHAFVGMLLGGMVGGGLLLTDILPGSSDPVVAVIVVLGGMTTMAPLVFATAVGLLDRAKLEHGGALPAKEKPRRTGMRGGALQGIGVDASITAGNPIGRD